MSSFQVPYPPAPAGVAADLARPSGAFKLQAWAAVLGLALFLVLYFGLAAWFGWIAYAAIRDLLHDPENWLLSACKAFGGLFFFGLMVKGIFFVRRTPRADLVEITEAEEPTLLAFVRQVAKDAGAPRPHKVFLSGRVNAAVFYDLSLWNLIVPSRKNLEVGIGLVNALSLDEFKAVVAHEFGHFAQRTMSVGSWVYIARSFVHSLVERRDIFDRFLDGISRFDLRVAWIGWLMRLVVWSLRAVFDTFFRGLTLLERAMYRQMEFQADLVSVSLAGSDSLVHALHRLGAADDAWDRALGFCTAECHQQRRVSDLFAVQSRVLERMATILDDPAHGRTPPVPEAREGHRLFSSALADVPRMWSTHPPNHEREDNAKRRYYPSALDPRPAWLLFRDPDGVRARLTEHVLKEALEDELPPVAPLPESLARLDESFSRSRLDPRYRGAFLREPLVRHADATVELVEHDPLPDPRGALAGLYPATLPALLERTSDLEEEKVLLEGLYDGFLVPPDGTIRFRGREIRRKELPGFIAQVTRELAAARGEVEAHDRRARTVHRALARPLGRGWEAHLEGLLAIVHYAEHVAADLADARGHVRHVVAIVTADKRVSDSEMGRLMASCDDAHHALGEIIRQRNEVWLPPPLRQRLEVDAWGEMLPDPELAAPHPQLFAQGWLSALENIVDGVLGRLTRLRNVSLDLLVEAEGWVARCAASGEDPGDAPPRARVPAQFTRLLPGRERPRQKRLGWWDRFVTADGFVPGTLRLAVATAVLAPLLALSFTPGLSGRTIAVHNGLGVPVRVEIDGDELGLAAHGSARLEHEPGRVRVRAVTAAGAEIEDFLAHVPRHGAIVYNVAGASTVAELTATYGAAREVPPRVLGAQRWLEHTADDYFTEPPSNVSVRAGGSVSRRVLRALDDLPPGTQLANAGNVADERALLVAHLRFDPPGPGLVRWFALAPPDGEIDAILRERIGAGRSVPLLRLQLDRADRGQWTALCASHQARAKATPDDPDALYLAARCIGEDRTRDEAFLAAHARFPAHPWLRYAAATVRAERGEWEEAREQIEALFGAADARDEVGAETLADYLARLRRVTSDAPVLSDLVPYSPNLEMELEIEGGLLGDRAPPAAKAFRHLGKGELNEALWVRDVPEVERALLVRLVAASDGATREQRDAGLALPGDQGLDWRTGLPTLALAVREGKDVAALKDALKPMKADAVVGVLDDKRLRKDPALLDRAVVGLDLRVRGTARAAGIVLLGDRAPPHWRKEGRALLFASERPYFEH